VRRWSVIVSLAVTPLVGMAACGDGEEGSADTSEIEGGTSICSAVSIVFPTALAALDDRDDLDGVCSSGLSVNVIAATDAPAGTVAHLLVDGDEVGAAVVERATLVFDDVDLVQQGSAELEVRVGESNGCDTHLTVNTNCEGQPSCEILSPEVTPTHPELNGVSTSLGGDRASAPNEPYQVVFDVLTSAENGELVTLTIDGVQNAAAAVVVENVAIFPAVTLVPDGPHEVHANCRAANGKGSSSRSIGYVVDTFPPGLAVTGVTDGQVVGPGSFGVCGTTVSSDAHDLADSLLEARRNLCVGINDGPVACVAAESNDGDTQPGACVTLECPTSPNPFDVVVSLHDAAGNPTTARIRGVTCTQ
jgi:hypothetical protein